jgi:hypothetical protein
MEFERALGAFALFAAPLIGLFCVLVATGVITFTF